jgi:hypothetical protein
VIRTHIIKLIKKGRVSVMRKSGCCKRVWHQRKSWVEFCAAQTDRQFRHYFQMSGECFDMLCTNIKSNVGEGAFKSEQYLSELLSTLASPNSVAESQMRGIVQGHYMYTGGIICGEVKLAITLRMLAGGSFFNLGIIFGTGITHPYAIFRHVILNWICNDRLVNISGIDYCKDEDRMNAVARDFADGLNHLFSGCIGVVDGWIVKILGDHTRRMVYRIPNLSTVGRGSTDLVSRPLLIIRSVYSSAALSPEALSMTPLRSREWVCTNGSWKTIGMSLKGEANSSLVTPHTHYGHSS